MDEKSRFARSIFGKHFKFEKLSANHSEIARQNIIFMTKVYGWFDVGAAGRRAGGKSNDILCCHFSRVVQGFLDIEAHVT